MIDLEPATRAVTALIASIRDDQLDDPTPCEGTSLAAMLDHVEGFATGFALAARKQVPPGGSQAPVIDAARLAPVWRTRIPARLADLAAAWHDEAAWSGMTEAGGVQLPAEIAGIFALDEVVVHGWDLAAATGRRIEFDDALLAPLHEFLTASVAQHPDGSPGLFGPPIAVPPDAPLLDRVLGLTGRDPQWRLERTH
jgi:uncharacterized protein (TIGR03086 family)